MKQKAPHTQSSETTQLQGLPAMLSWLTPACPFSPAWLFFCALLCCRELG